MKLRDLRVGARLHVTEAGDVFLLADLNHKDYPGAVLVADEPVANMCFDSVEPDNPLENRSKNGSNNYALSNIHQWLNAEGTGWYRPTSETDRPPENFIDPMMPPEFRSRLPECVTEETPGFLSRIPAEVRALMKTVRVSYVLQTAEGQGSPAEVEALAFVPSQTELGHFLDIEYPDGTCFKLMEDPRMKLCRGGYWTRTPGFPDGDDVILPWHMRAEKTSGVARTMEGMLYKFYGNKSCCSVTGVRPAIVLDPETEVQPQEDGSYVIGLRA